MRNPSDCGVLINHNQKLLRMIVFLLVVPLPVPGWGNNGDMTWVDNFRLSTYIFLSHYFVMQGVELLKTEEQRSLADGQIASHEEPSWFILSLVCF